MDNCCQADCLFLIHLHIYIIHLCIYMKIIQKTPTSITKPKEKCCYAEKCCANIEWSIGYLIGETVSCFVNLCLRFVNNANKGFASRNKPNYSNMRRRSTL